MKVAIIFALIAAVSAGNVYLAPTVGGVQNTGSSSSSRSEDGLGNYQFSYTEQGLEGGTARQESGDASGRVQGSYTLNVGDGRQRVVNYVADEFGYRASIQTNEPGSAPLAGADTTISAPDTTGIAAATNQRTAEQLKALAEAPVHVEAPQVVAKPLAAVSYQAAPAVAVQAAPALAYAAAPIAYQSYQVPAVRAVPTNYQTVVSHNAPLVAKPVFNAPIAYTLAKNW